jgi:hypothetical protein
MESQMDTNRGTRATRTTVGVHDWGSRGPQWVSTIGGHPRLGFTGATSLMAMNLLNLRNELGEQRATAPPVCSRLSPLT